MRGLYKRLAHGYAVVAKRDKYRTFRQWAHWEVVISTGKSRRHLLVPERKRQGREEEKRENLKICMIFKDRTSKDKEMSCQ